MFRPMEERRTVSTITDLPLYSYQREKSLFFSYNPPYNQQFRKNTPGAACRRQPAVTVAGPVNRKFFNPATFFYRSHYDFYIERKSIGNAFTI
jgi:hypothetical protein